MSAVRTRRCDAGPPMQEDFSSRRPWLLCMGTRPAIIKMAPLCRALRAAGAPVRVLHAAHDDPAAWPLYRFFAMRPDYELVLERTRDGLAPLAGELLVRFSEVIEHARPGRVLVHGDSVSAFAAASAASFAGVPVDHVEAGLRTAYGGAATGAEKNRELISRLAARHFAPTQQARANLLREGIADEAIVVTGNTVVDATRLALDRLRVTGGELIDAPLRQFLAAHASHRLVLVTAHGDGRVGAVHNVAMAVARFLRARPDVAVVWPLAADRATANEVATGLGELDPLAAARLLVTDPLDYPSLISALRRCWLVLTDSGGLQEEAASLGVPILVLRETTDRPEILATGCGRLVGTEAGAIVAAVDELAQNDKMHAAMRYPAGASPFGDGHAADRICEALLATA